MTHPLQSFFWPQSIAVLGASPDLHRIRGRLLHQLRENGFPGRILPINPSYQEIEGLPCYPSIAAVGAPVDLALVAIPAAGVAPALEECANAGREERADHQLGLRRGRRRGRRHAGGSGGRDATHRHPRLRSELRRLLQRAGQGRDHVQPDGGNQGRRRPRPGLRTPRRRDRAIRRHRLRAVQSRQGGGNRIFLRDLHGKRGRSEHGRLPRLHGRGSAHACRHAVLRGGAQRPQLRRGTGEGARSSASR